MELKATTRESGKKSELGRIRREGNIPAVIYSSGKEAVPVSIDGVLFRASLRKMTAGCLATQKFKVNFGNETFTVIVKDIHYERTTYDILHIDFMRVAEDDVVTVHVPVVCKGKEQCIGVSQGGQLKVVKRSVKVSMKLKDMPEAFIVDVSPISLGESFRVRDVPMVGSMKPKIDGSQVLLSVSK
jgi:large subunit ribosomal protein L25